MFFRLSIFIKPDTTDYSRLSPFVQFFIFSRKHLNYHQATHHHSLPLRSLRRDYQHRTFCLFFCNSFYHKNHTMQLNQLMLYFAYVQDVQCIFSEDRRTEFLRNHQIDFQFHTKVLVTRPVLQVEMY